jgi:hypothetical protein
MSLRMELIGLWLRISHWELRIKRNKGDKIRAILNQYV